MAWHRSGRRRLTPVDGWDYGSGSVLRAAVAILLTLATIRTPPARATEVPTAALAIKICQQADDLPEQDKIGQLAILDRGVKVAEAAVAANPDDARTHLALSCNLGKQLALAGISWRSLSRLKRLREVIDTAYHLAPEDPDVIVARGEFLRRVPGVLGGDVVEAERCFHRALEKSPEHLQAHLCFAHLLAERGDPDARREATLALSLARQSGTPRQIADARELLHSLE